MNPVKGSQRDEQEKQNKRRRRRQIERKKKEAKQKSFCPPFLVSYRINIKKTVIISGWESSQRENDRKKVDRGHTKL